MKYVLAVFFIGVLGLSTCLADDCADAESLLKTKLDAALVILQQRDVPAEVKKEEVSRLVTPIFDFELMAKLTLGRKYWPGLTPPQREDFIDTFVAFLKASYLDKMMMYTDEKIVYSKPVKKKNKVHINTDLISGDNKISMVYKFYRGSEDLKIYDIEVQGVSLIVTYRSQFDSILQKGGFEDLLNELKNRNIKQPSVEAAAKQPT